MISPYSLTVPGGVQGQILGLARALRELGESVRVLGPCDGPPPESFVTSLGNSMPTGANGSVAPIAPDPAAQLRTIRALRDEAFDVLHLHEPLAPGPTTTAILIKPAPIVGTFHAAGTSLAYEAFRPLLARGAKRIDRRFAVSEDARDMAFAALGGTYEILFNGVDLSAFAGVTPEPTAKPTIFFIARHEERKGLRVLLEAMTHVPKDCELVVAGTGPESAQLQAEFATDARVRWLGEIDDAAKIVELKRADVFCAPSLRGESFGIVLLEAMAADTAVVASDLSGYARVARHGQDAALVPPGDAQALGQALTLMLANEATRRTYVESGRARVEQFSMARLADAYRSAYYEVGVRTSGAARPLS